MHIVFLGYALPLRRLSCVVQVHPVAQCTGTPEEAGLPRCRGKGGAEVDCGAPWHGIGAGSYAKGANKGCVSSNTPGEACLRG